MKALGIFRATLLAATLALWSLLGITAAVAQNPNYVRLLEGDSSQNRPIYLGINKSMVVDLPRASSDVLVSNPEIADAVLRTSTRLYLIGVKLGQASVFLFDGGGQTIASFDIYVEADLSTLNQIIAEAIPDGFVRAEALNGSIVLRGQVMSASDAATAQVLTTKMVAPFISSITDASTNIAAGTTAAVTENVDTSGLPGVINLITIVGEEQVTLKVTIAEVQRQVVKQLGINVGGGYDSSDLQFGTSGGGASGIGLSPLIPSLGIVGTAGEVGVGFEAGGFSVAATLRALEETNMIRTLAEPVLTAVSGETAEFLAGGEFGYQTFTDTDDSEDRLIIVQFKEFGVSLAFTPNVLSSGRINLHLRTSVSDIAGTTFGIPSLNTRRTETTVELPSGGAFVISGLIQESTRRAATGFPGLQHIPILGALFASKAYQSAQTELVMIVTPYIVKPTKPADLARPDENLVMADDAEAYLLNQLTEVYGRAEKAPGGPASGPVGFTFD